MLELYHNDMSVCAQKVRVVIAQKQLDCLLHPLNIRAGDTHTPAYRAINPKRVVPTLVADGVPIVESTVICEYLDDAYPEIPLRPLDPVERAVMRNWTLRPDAGLHRACAILSFALAFRHQNTSHQMNIRAQTAATAQLRNVIEQGLESEHLVPQLAVWQDLMDDMARRLEHNQWLAGDTVSLADIAILPYICRLRDMQQSWLWTEMPGRLPIAAWLELCEALTGYSGIAQHLDPKYVALMQHHGTEGTDTLRRLFAANSA